MKKVKLKFIPIGNKKVEKTECVVSNQIRYYKGRKIEIGLTKADHFLTVFVDDIWLTGTPIGELYDPAFKDLDSEAQDTVVDLTVQTIRLAEKIIDKVEEHKQEDKDTNDKTRYIQ